MSARESTQPIDVEAIVSGVVASRKYATICEDTIRRAAQAALRTTPKRVSDAVHYAKEKLHQWCAAYRDGDFAKLASALDEVDFEAGVDGVGPRAFALEVMQLHASTAERQYELDAIGTALREESAGARGVVDLCGGANAFALPWIGLGGEVEYVAYEIDRRVVDLTSRWLAKRGAGRIVCRDVLADPPGREIGDLDVVWLLKSAPCLERQETGSVVRLLREMRARRIVMSFPTKSLSGREKGMAENYASFAREVAVAVGRNLRTREFASEHLHILEPVAPGAGSAS